MFVTHIVHTNKIEQCVLSNATGKVSNQPAIHFKTTGMKEAHTNRCFRGSVARRTVEGFQWQCSRLPLLDPSPNWNIQIVRNTSCAGLGCVRFVSLRLGPTLFICMSLEDQQIGYNVLWIRYNQADTKV